MSNKIKLNSLIFICLLLLVIIIGAIVTTNEIYEDNDIDIDQNSSDTKVNSLVRQDKLSTFSNGLNENNPMTNDLNEESLTIQYSEATTRKGKNLQQSNINLSAIDLNSFVTNWNTSKPGSSASNQVKLPLESTGTYNFEIDWGDGIIEIISSYNQTEVRHNYTTTGIYTIIISGTLNGWRFNNGGDRLKIIEIAQWGNISLGNSGSYFYGAQNLVLTATDAPDLSETTTLYQSFRDCHSLGNSGNMKNWNTSTVTSMNRMFSDASSFNQDISSWDVSNVIDLNRIFLGATSFNQPLSAWNVSSVTDMRGMFSDASSFNQPIGTWDVSSVITMEGMFWFATSFNQPLGSWNTSNVTDMGSMFFRATSFDQPLGNWNVSNVTDMHYMFTSVTLSIENYNNLLIGWSSLTLSDYVFFTAGGSQYDTRAVEARQHIIDTYHWKIDDGGRYTEPKDTSSSDMSYELSLISILMFLLHIPIRKKAIKN